MRNKFKAVAIMTLSFLLCITNVLAEPKNNTLLANGPIDIGTRVGKPELNILENSNIVFRDTEGNIVENPSINSKVVVRFDWSLLNEDSLLIQDGDYYSFKLPEVFKIHTEMSGSLGDYGTFKIDTTGTVTFTFNEAVSQSSNVKGYIQFDAKFNEKIIGGPGEKVIELPISKDNEFKFNVTPISKDTSIEKNGKLDKELNPSKITWEVKINKAYETLSNVVVQDTLPQGLTLEGVEVYPVNLNHDGSFHSYGEKVSTSLYKVEGSSVSFNNAINQPYAIRYITKIDEAVKPNGGGDVTFKNYATMTSKENDVIVTDSTVIASYGKLLTKQKPTYNAADQSFTWTVLYNYGDKTIQNPLLEDIFDGDLEYVAGSFVVTDSNGKPVNYKYTLSNDPKNKLNIQFEEPVSKALKLTYKTKIKDGKLIVENKEYSNSITTGSTSSGSVGTAKPQMIHKTTPAIDYKNKLIDWKIDVNINRYEMRNYTVTDTYSYIGLSLVDASFEVYDVTKKRLVDPVNYELVKRYENDVEAGFQIIFKGEYETTSSQLQISFKTNYDVNHLVGGDGSTFRNHASLDWTDKDNVKHKHTSQADRKVNSQTVKNGQKSGSYNAITKEITWKVDVNYNSEELKNAKIVDVIQAGQKYIDGSLVIKTYTVDTNGNLVANSTTEDLSLFDIEYPDPVNNNTLTISLPNKNDLKYSIEFKTSVRSEAIKSNYKNRAVFTNGDYVRNLDASVTVTNGEKYVTKTGKQDGSLIHWSIAINESQSTIKDAELHDYPSTNQILLENTFKLYPVTVHENGAYTIDTKNPLEVDKEYVVLFNTDAEGKQVFVLKFLNTIDRTYVLEYDSQISTTPDNKTISNRVSLKGKELSYEDSGGTTSIVIDVNQAGGGAVGVKGSLTIQKTDEHGNPLEGVEFELYNPLNRKVATRLTDAEGKISFVGMVYGNFTIKETKALEGYVIDEELFNGKVITINEETSGPNHIVALRNRMNTLTINKQNVKGDLLDGAEFKLEKKNGEAYDLIHQSISLPNGQLILSGLKSGMYRLTELVAPQGYVRNLESLEFEITENSIGQAEDITLSYTNYKGSVRLKKTGETGDVLPGVTFNLYDVNNNLVLENLVSDKNGEVLIENQLSPGEYYFIEKETVDGYIVNESPYHFEISGESKGVPSVVEVKAVNYKGSVEFKKVSNTGEVLSDVEFELYQSGNETPIEKVVSDEIGMVRVNQLAPGSYYFKEVQPKEGYILNTKHIAFTIPQKANHERVIVALDDFINYRGIVEFKKTNEKGDALSGVVFELFEEGNETALSEHVSNGMGIVSAKDLAPGSYYFKEKETLDAYILNSNPIDFIIEETAEEDNTKITLPDFVNYTGTVEFKKLGEDGEILSDVEFELVNAVEDKVIDVVQSDSNGRVSVDNLAPGNYYFRETKAKSGYIINSKLIEFIIPETSANEKLVVELDDFINYTGTVEITKLNDEGIVLPGVEFELYREGKLDAIANYISDENGIVKADKLGPGKYYFKEVKALPEYILNTNMIEFVIPESSVQEDVYLDLGSFVNHRGMVEFTKKSETGEGLSGVEFDLYREGQETPLLSLSSDVEGLVKVSQLAPGTYYFKETKANDGYLINSNKIEFVIPEETDSDYTHIVLDDFINTKATVSFTKRAIDGKPLSGAIFELYQEGHDEVIAEAVSDDNGLVQITSLAPGKYSIKEKLAAEGYILNSMTIDFIVPVSSNEEKPLIQLDDFINYQGGVMVEKVDTDGNRIGEAVFELRNSQGITLAEQTTTNGLTYFSQLQPGEYTLIEVMAPEGYVASDVEYQVVIASEFNGVYLPEKVIVVNDKQEDTPKPIHPQPEDPNVEIPEEDDLPDTGVSNSVMHSSIASLMLGLVILVLNKRRSSKAS